MKPDAAAAVVFYVCIFVAVVFVGVIALIVRLVA